MKDKDLLRLVVGIPVAKEDGIDTAKAEEMVKALREIEKEIQEIENKPVALKDYLAEATEEKNMPRLVVAIPVADKRGIDTAEAKEVLQALKRRQQLLQEMKKKQLLR